PLQARTRRCRPHGVHPRAPGVDKTPADTRGQPLAMNTTRGPRSTVTTSGAAPEPGMSRWPWMRKRPPGQSTGVFLAGTALASRQAIAPSATATRLLMEVFRPGAGRSLPPARLRVGAARHSHGLRAHA